MEDIPQAVYTNSIDISTPPESAMTSLTTNASQAKSTKASLTLASVIAALFAIKLREKLDADTSGDKSDAAYTWGM